MTWVQGNSGGNAGVDTQTVAFSSNVTQGNALLAFASYDMQSGGGYCGAVDTQGNLWLPVVLLPGVDNSGLGDERISAWWTVAQTTGPCTVQTRSASAAGDGCLHIGEWSGRDPLWPVTGFAINRQLAPGTGADGLTCGPLTLLAGDDVAVFWLDTGALRVANMFSVGSTGMTERSETGNGSNIIDAALHTRDNLSAGAFTPKATAAFNDKVGSIYVALSTPGLRPLAGWRSPTTLDDT